MLHGDVLGERARLTPDRLAVVDLASGARLTYAEVDARAARCAALWRDTLGLRRGDRYGILSANRIEFLDAFFAAAKSGIVLVPLGTRLTAAELSVIVADAELSGLFYDRACADTVRTLQSLTATGQSISLDDEYPRLVARSEPRSFERTSADDIYMLCYTSGTTGRPKGVMIPHRMIAWNGYNTVACWGLSADDVSPIFTPLYHVGGLCAFLVPLVVAGGAIVLHARFDADEIWATIVRERCTVVLGVPTIWKLLMEAPAFATADLAAVRAFYSGGAPLPQFIIDAYQRRGVVFKQGYGLTEVGVNCFAMTVDESVRKAGTIGKPMMFTEARLVDADGREVPANEVGELWLRGPHVSLGYWRNPEATAAALDADGWFHTGDLAKRDEEGFFSIAGRQKDMIISGGVNVYPAEIEAQLLQHPGVRDCAVVGVPDDTWGEAGVAFVVADDRQPPTSDALQAFLLARLAKFKLPRHWVFLDALPRTPYGKVVKPQLREKFLHS
jgi:fatty-acyl-CoA synthase